jgi:hypothetical protein
MRAIAGRGFPVKEQTFGAFDFLIIAFLNIGNYMGKRRRGCLEGKCAPEFYTLPVTFIKDHHGKSSSWEQVMLSNLNTDEYEGEKGFELIAQALGIPYPARPQLAAAKAATQI